jgi:glycine cleavage system H protein
MLPFPENLYFHQEHTWVHYEGPNLCRIGVDEIFLKDLKSSITDMDLPTEGDEISQDEVCGILRGKSTRKAIFAPLSGEIVDVNQDLLEDPEILVEDPYGVGWILLIDPSEPQEELENLLHGEQVIDWWMTELRNRQAASPEPQP